MKKNIFFILPCFFLTFSSLAFCLPAVAANPLLRGIAEYREERFEEALISFKQAEKDDPASSITAFYLGLTFKQTGDYEKAVRHYRKALILKPRINDAYTEIIEVLMRMDRTSEASGYILEAESEGIRPDQIAFLKGLNAARRGKSEEAIQAFQDAIQKNPDLSTAAELQIAMLHVQEGKLRRAKNSLEALSTMAPDTDQADFAKEYSESLSLLMERHRKWHFSLGAEGRYDDNVIASPSTRIRGIDITDKKDTALSSSFQVRFSPLLDRPFSFNGRLAMNSTVYRDTSTHNTLMPSLSLSPAFHFKGGNLSLPLLWDRTWLGGHEYMSNASIRPTLLVQMQSNHTLRLSAAYTRREMLQAPRLADENRDSDIYTASAAYFYSFTEAGGLFHIRYEHIRDEAEGNNWKNKGQRYGAGILIPLQKKIRLSFSAEHLKQDYSKEHSVFGIRRRDKDTAWTALFLWDLSPNLLFSLSYTGSRDDSNIPIYEYRRNVLSAGLEYRF
ncbi:tetratricopeptide repeat protein [Desulfobotulus alkaliphilus]|uniref:Tetratricopeptide repeat protein n=1 Tax=Desulfobotulus alkaliphilus TaxID=622671 RepID=A0A562RGJ7_9BACT|nr:tetratricopeptide repeat protein [Desulfobotulus alkaliphilus]TWI68108.1 tetratricopeptide repeat protein [Desulfobotulus alkaliphilus]